MNKESNNTAWKHPAFRAYADYMETTDFKTGIDEITAIALRKRTAIMCAEALWWKCHRSLIFDYLKIHGWTVNHILAINKSEEHPYTKAAKIISGTLNYSAGDLFKENE